MPFKGATLVGSQPCPYLALRLLPREAAHFLSHVPHRSLLSNTHFLLLVFLEVPLFLSLLSAVLWVTRPLRRPRVRRNQPDFDNQYF